MGASSAREGVLGFALVAAILIGAPAASAAGPIDLSDPAIDGGDVKDFAISPDSSRIVYTAANGLFSVPLTGGTPVRLGPVPFEYQVSPNSARVVTLDVAGLHSVPIGGGAVVDLGGPVGPPGFVATNDRVVWPDGSLPPNLHSVPITGGSRVTLSQPGEPGSPIVGLPFLVSADGAWAVFRRTVDEKTVERIFSVPVSGGVPTQLSAVPTFDFAITSDSGRVVIDGPPLTIVPIDGGAATSLDAAGGGDFSFTPDDRFVVYRGGPNGFASVPTAGGPVADLNPAGRSIVDAKTTTDRVLYRATIPTKAGRDLFTVPVAGGAPVMLNRPGSDTNVFLPTADSTRAVFTDGPVGAPGAPIRHQLFSTPLGGGPQIQLDRSLSEVGRVRAAPTGDVVGYLADEDAFGQMELFVVTAAGGERRKMNGPLSPTGDVTEFAFAPTRDFVVWLQEASPAALLAAPLASEPDTVGLVDPSQGRWHLRDTAGQVTSFFFGNPGDIPVMGDWECNGVDTPGLFRQSDAFAYLSNANRSQIADIRFFFGDPSDVPLAGDFDGDGCDTLSIYRPSEGRFYIINELGENEGGLGAADFSFGFGDLGDKPVVGDWDGDGIDEIGLHRESTGLFYWRNTLTTGIADGSIIFGDPNDRFVAGDWGTVDGRDTPGLFRPSATTFFFRHTLTQGNADDQFTFGEAAWLPVAGEFGF